MLKQTFNILVVGRDQNLIHLLKGVLGSVDYALHTTVAGPEIINTISEKPFHLVILDQTGGRLEEETVKTLFHSFPELQYIIISQDFDSFEQWPEFKKISFVKKSQMNSRLPLLLSNAYTTFNESHTSNLESINLMRTALEESPVFTAIVDVDGNILFLNRSARDILKIGSEESDGLKFFDFLKDGEKVWQFLIMRWNEQTGQPIGIDLHLTDKYFNEFPFPVLIRPVKNNELYFIIQGKTLTEPELTWNSADPQTLLKAFSESLANDLLNPLNVIWGRLQLFQSNDQLKDNDLHNIQLIEKQLSRINDVISKLVAVTSLKRDLVPHRVFLNDVFKNLILQPTLKNLLDNQNSTIDVQLEPLPPIYGQTAQIELLFSTLIDLIFQLSGTNSKITITNRSLNAKRKNDELILDFILEDTTHVPDQLLLKSCLQFGESDKKKFALETTIVRYLLDEYQIKHHLKETDSSLILSLVFPLK